MTAFFPAAFAARIASLTSGSSQGIAGLPLRDWYTNSHSGAATPACSIWSTTSFAASRCCAA
ncbi:MAG: Uncharacterised protein [Cellulomonadaceae bacterium TMED98]|nr:MAG: Uncharacterised protein [Cellulomonadaceae bacterium TMED98]